MTVQPRPRGVPFATVEVAGESKAAAMAQRRAWLYLWVAFAIWIALVASGAYAANTWRKSIVRASSGELVCSSL